MLLLHAAIEGCPKAFARVVGGGQLLQVIYNGLKSPIAADGLAKVLFALRKSVFEAEDETLGQIVAAVTLRVLCPAKNLNQKETWSKAQLNERLESVLDRVSVSFIAGEAVEARSVIMAHSLWGLCYKTLLIRNDCHINISWAVLQVNPN